MGIIVGARMATHSVIVIALVPCMAILLTEQEPQGGTSASRYLGAVAGRLAGERALVEVHVSPKAFCKFVRGKTAIDVRVHFGKGEQREAKAVLRACKADIALERADEHVVIDAVGVHADDVVDLVDRVSELVVGIGRWQFQFQDETVDLVDYNGDGKLLQQRMPAHPPITCVDMGERLCEQYEQHNENR